jgi:cystathionine beta-synthase
VHIALEVARELGKGKVVAVVLTDTGNNYITKFFNDEWMKDNGFAVDDKSPGRVKDLIGSRKQKVLFAEKGQRIDAVVEQMRKHGSARCRSVTPWRNRGDDPRV